MPDVALGGIHGLDRLLALLLVADHLQEHARAFAVRGKRDLGHIAKGNPGIAQFTFNDGAYLFLKRLTHPFPVMLSTTLLRHFRDEGKLLRISKKAYVGIGE